MIDRDAAIEIARATAKAEGGAFAEAVATRVGRPGCGGGGRWEIRPHAVGRCAMARFVIDASDGRVTDKGYIPRYPAQALNQTPLARLTPPQSADRAAGIG